VRKNENEHREREKGEARRWKREGSVAVLLEGKA
jgi:hypothetical protein